MYRNQKIKKAQQAWVGRLTYFKTDDSNLYKVVFVMEEIDTTIHF